jgi:Cu/Ag efflux pump CusA
VSRYLDITARVTDGDDTDLSTAIEGRIAQMSFPLQYHAEILSDFSEAQAIRTQLILTALASMVGIFLLVQSSVRSWALGTAVFVALLAAISGGVFAIALQGMLMSVGALAGLFGVLAVASRGALVLIRNYQSLEREGFVFGADLITRGTRESLGPVVATGVGTALAVAPAAALSHLAGLESVGPVAWVLIGGMTTTTAVNLIVVPMLYLMFGAGSAAAEADLGSEEGQYHAA